MDQNVLWAATSVDVRPSRCYPISVERVVIEGGEIVFRNGHSDPLLLRNRFEAESFINMLSRSI